MENLPETTKNSSNKTLTRNLQIAELYMSGMNQYEIAPIFGLSQQGISKILRKDECVKYFIDKATRSMATMLPRVVNNYDEFLEDEDPDIRLKASRDVMKNTGVAPSNVANVTINNIMQTNNLVTDERTMEILRNALAPEKALDADFEVVEDD